jgi:hypothetical protein
MCSSKNCISGKESTPFNTLAQSGTTLSDKIVLTASTDKSDKVRLLSRAKRKYLSTNLALPLIDLVKEEKFLAKFSSSFFSLERLKVFERSFWNMYRCADTLYSDRGKITARYCRNRFCLVCNSIRQAVNMNKHLPIIKAWKDIHFVTLTLKNIDKYELKNTMEVMQSTFVDIKDMMNKRYKRKKGNKFLGIKKLECTYNHKTNEYHPHYHFIIEGKENAELLRSEWLSRTAKKGILISPKAQNVKRGNINSAKELFKYFTKVVTTVKGKSGNKHRIYLNSLLVMFDAFRGVRTFSKFGFKLPEASEEEISKEEELKEPDDVGFSSLDSYVWKGKDWYSIKSGNNLTGHKPSNLSMQIVAGIRKNNIPLPFD